MFQFSKVTQLFIRGSNELFLNWAKTNTITYYVMLIKTEMCCPDNNLQTV